MMKLTGVALCLIVAAGCIADPVSASGKDDKGNKNVKKEKKHVKKKDALNENAVSARQIVNAWHLPAELREISGLAYLDKDRLACVQDESGTIYVYNTTSRTIEKRIPFADPGDYEGIALAGSTAYVIRSDGRLFEVANYLSARPVVKQYSTPFNENNNVEGLCYDKNGNRLLLALKGDDFYSRETKGIYVFDLASRQMQKKPLYQVDLSDPALVVPSLKKKKAGSALSASGICVHPVTSKIYITDAMDQKLLVLNRHGALESVTPLSPVVFAKPEGISFSPEGNLFISNEGKKQEANILEVSF